jgi:hypothetical protein
LINHARNLLVNLSGAGGFDTSALGEEIIDPSFIAVSIPGGLLPVWNTLFGSNPDREMRNYRARQLLQLVQQSDLESFITDLDSRLTYDLPDDTFLDNTLFDPIIGGTDKTLAVINRPDPPDETGKMKYRWELLAGSGTVTDLLTGTERSFGVSGGLSDPILLPGTRQTYVTLQNPAANDLWTLAIRVRPAWDLGELLAALDNLSGEALTELFYTTQPAGSQEPFKTFRNLWEQHYDLPHRMGGLVLALIYHLDDLRAGT